MRKALRNRSSGGRRGRIAVALALIASVPGVGIGIGLVSDDAQLWRASDLWTGGSPPVPGTFGQTVAVGDFDGDGIDDVAIGDPTADIGLLEEAGTVSVLYGTGAGLSGAGSQLWHQDVGAVPDVVEAFDWFGFALAVGDFDNDGYDDLAIGTPLENAGALTNTGSVQVLYGSASGLVDAGAQDWHQDSTDVPDTNEAGDLFGWALTTGDFDGDGYDDLAIGVPNEDTTIFGDGQVIVLYGSVSGLFASALSSQSFVQGMGGLAGTPENNDFFGEVLASGDFDADGYDDLAVGVPNEDFGAIDNGVVQIILGSAGGLTTTGNATIDQQDISPQTWETDDHFGASLAAGDFDGDGLDELAIGTPGENAGIGFVHVMQWNGFAWNAQLPLVRQGTTGMPGTEQADDLFGAALSAGDFDGDGYVDLAIGVPGDWNPYTATGSVHVLYGTSSGLSVTGNQYWGQTSFAISGTGPDSAESFGAALAAGDFNADGADDLAVGVPGDKASGVPVGGVNALYSIGLCPNGVVDPGEECDDDNLTSEDGCSATCALEFCGDGVIQAGLGEACDDGNTASEDGCSNVCIPEFCGDGVIQPGLGESCDDGNNVSEDGCSDVCIAEFCGDGVIQAGLGETCDDGNTVPEDGCSAACWSELGSADLFGTAMGGTVSITVSGVMVSIQTTPAHSAAEVLDALRAAIVADPTLAGLGAQAAVVGDRLYVSGAVSGYAIADSGLAATPSPAVTLAHSDAASFTAALAGPAASEDFDALTGGDPVGILGGLLFGTAPPVESPRATEAFDTASAPVSLGIDNLDEALLDGDSLTIQLAQFADAVALRIVTSDPALLDEIVLVTPVGAAANSDVAESTLPDGGRAYFVGLTSDTPFDEVVLGFDDDAQTNFVYTVDDVRVRFVPEPGVVAGLVTGVVFLAWANARRRRCALARGGG